MESNVPGTLVILVGGTGVGKGELMKCVLAEVPWLGHARSWTSREQREGEANHAYHFVTQEVFERMINDGQFLEYAQPFKDDPVQPRPDYYGRTEESFALLKQGTSCVCDMTEHGVARLQELIGEGKFPHRIIVIRVIAKNRREVLARTQERAASDQLRTRIKIRIDKEVENDFSPGGLKRSTVELVRLVLELLRVG